MRERGLNTERGVLAIFDGAKAHAKALRDVYGPRALIQRCQARKVRNVTDQLPEDMRPSVRQALRDAYGANDAARARRTLGDLVRRLRAEHPGAASSLEEGLDETLTVKRLGLPAKLERQLSTTNAIENLIGSLRRIAGRVRRWRGGRMLMRWTVAAIADAATRFRRGVNSTPTFFINGTHVGGAIPKEQFKSMIDDKLKEVEKSGVAPGDYYDKVIMATGEKKFRSAKDPKSN